jgi:rsbT co-antagonist protein RsbR
MTEALVRELERVKQRNKKLRDSSSLALIELDTDGRIVGWNRQAEVVFGWPEHEILGRYFDVIVPEAARLQVDGIFRALISGEMRHSRNANVRKDGSLIICQWYNDILRDESGRVYLLYCEVRDVTAEEGLRSRQRLMQSLADFSPLGIFAKLPDGPYFYANEAFARILGVGPGDLVGKTDFDLFPRAIAEDIRRHDDLVMNSDSPLTREDTGMGVTPDAVFWSMKFCLRDGEGKITAICCIINDLTEIRRSQRERDDLQQRVIASQQLALAELSSPLLRVADGVLVMPLIGTFDDARAEQFLQVLLSGVAQQRAHTVILDVTGVRAPDTSSADVLLRAAQATRLLGSEVVVTGIGPVIAQTLVELGVDFATIVTLSDLQSGVRYAFTRDRRSR